MRALTYIVPQEKLAGEIEWLNNNLIYPAVQRHIDWEQCDKEFWLIGMILSPEDELSVKLHVSKILTQKEWTRK